MNSITQLSDHCVSLRNITFFVLVLFADVSQIVVPALEALIVKGAASDGAPEDLSGLLNTAVSVTQMAS